MAKGPRLDNALLLEAGIRLMEKNGKNLRKLPSRGRSMLFEVSDGQSVRARTCNDHILIAVADSPEEGAKLNIEGTDWLLIVMPVEERTPGDVIAYLVPTEEAVAAARKTHADWIAGGANTKGANTTWNLWFTPYGPEKASGFAEKWAKYRLEGTVRIDGVSGTVVDEEADDAPMTESQVSDGKVTPMNMPDAKRALAAFYGVEPGAIEIVIRG